MIRLMTVVVLLFVAAPAAAQTCTTGKRCGDTCIAQSDTCHVDDSSGSSGGGTSPYAWPLFCGGLVCGSGVLAVFAAAAVAISVVAIMVQRWAAEQGRIYDARHQPTEPSPFIRRRDNKLKRSDDYDLLEQE